MALSASDVPAMYSLLANSMSGEESVRKPAEAALSQSESRPGFCSCLLVLLALSIFRSRVLLWFLFRYNSLRPSSMFQIRVRIIYVNAGSNYGKGFSISGGYPVDGFGVFQE